MRKINTRHFGWYLLRVAYLEIKDFPMRTASLLKQTVLFGKDLGRYLKILRYSDKQTPVYLYGQLHDRTRGTHFDHQYVYQSWWAFQHIHQTHPAEHVDVGSLIDFVGYVSTVCKTTFIDIRPPEVRWPNFFSRDASILKLPYPDNSLQSLSCMHVAEHIGLGRYGDPLDTQGTTKAMKELQRVLAPGGTLYFSTPTGRPRIYFNAHRISSPQNVIDTFNQLQLVELSAILDDDEFHANVTVDRISQADYACGLYKFVKPLNKHE